MGQVMIEPSRLKVEFTKENIKAKNIRVFDEANEYGYNSTNHSILNVSKSNKKKNNERKNNGHKEVDPTYVKDPVNVVTGSFSLHMVDLILSDLGEEFKLTRSYESLYENKQQHLGCRWVLNLGTHLDHQKQQVRILMDDLRIETFEQKDGIWQNRRGGDRSLLLTTEKHGYSLKFTEQQKIWDYNEFGNLIAIKDRCSNRVKIDYIGSWIDKVALANGQILHFTYENDKLNQIQDMLGRTIFYRYQGELLTEVTYPNDGTVQYEYNEQGHITAIIDQNGRRYVGNEYDGQGRVLRQTLLNGAETIFFYQNQDRMTMLSQPHNGERTSYHYNRQNLVEKIVYTDESIKETKYDDKENIIWEKDRNGNETFYTYNEASQLLEIKYPDGRIQTFAYDAAGRKISQQDNTGGQVFYRYDERGNLLETKSRIEGQLWQILRYTYDAKGRKTSQTDGNGNTTIFDYAENQHQPKTITTATGDITTYQYDLAGRCMTIENELGKKEYGYNHLDYQTVSIDALGNTFKYDYDKLGNMVKEIRPNQFNESSNSGSGWCYIYDVLDKRIAATDPLGNTIATLRDAEGNISKEINPNTYDEKNKDGKGIQNIYDADNRKIKIIYPDGGIERLTYDATGNLIKRVLPEDYNIEVDDGQGYAYTYDPMNRLTKIINPKGETEKTYVYDLAGNLIKEIDATSYKQGQTNATRPGILYQYNHLGWLTEKRIPIRKQAGQLRYQLIQYKYDNVGNCIEERRHLDEQDETSISGRVLSIVFHYDKENRRTKVTDNTGAVIEYGYNCINQKIYEKRKINETTQQSLRYRYDAAGRLIEIEQRADLEGSGDYTARTRYQLDKTGNVVKITTPAGYQIERQYDAADRLIAEIHKDKTSNIENKTEITYDKAGNIIKLKDNNDNEENYSYDLMNREIKRTDKNGGISRTIYDKNGRIHKKILPNQYQSKGENAEGYRYTYDQQGRIITTLAPDGTVIETNTYDADGRLLKRRDAAKSCIDYTYDLAGRIQHIQTAGGASQSYEYDAQGNIIGVVGGNQNKTEYKLDKWGRITEILKADGSRELYAYDYAGNLTETTNGVGNTIRYEYNLINKLKTITDQAGEVKTFLYDAEGRVKCHKNRNGNQIIYSYNLYDVLTEKLEENSGFRESYEYHQGGTLKSTNAQSMRYVYYPDGKLKVKTLISCEYDFNGNKIKQTDVTGKTTEFCYPETDMLNEIGDEGRSLVQFIHKEDGTLRETLQANGMRANYRYGVGKNSTGLYVKLGEQNIERSRYQYDSNGSRRIKEHLRGTKEYSYDNLNRLVKAQYPDYGEEIFYDKAGNQNWHIVNGIETQYI